MKKKEQAAVEKAEKPIETLQARTMAEWALGHHDGTRAGATLTVVSAIACGIQLCKAKDFLPHGEFMKWKKKYLQSISDRTSNNYVNLVQVLQIALKSKFATVANLLDVAPETMTLDYARRVAPHVAKIVEGKSVKELYEQFGIIKPRAESDQAAQDRLARVDAKNPKDLREKQLMLGRELFGDICKNLKTFETWVDEYELDTETNDAAVAKLTELLEKLTGGKVEVKYE